MAADQSDLIAQRHRAPISQAARDTRACCASSPAAPSTTASRTLIGRLLYDSKMIFEDQLARAGGRLQEASARRAASIDFALLVDGLAAEREQGITIDVAYRFFSTDKRKFIVADTPGHEQYTRNMVTGASTADLAVILIDARKGVLTQTRRHSFLVRLIGIRHVVLAVNKMDLVGYSTRRSSTRSSPTTAPSPTRSASPTSPPSRCRPCNGDNIAARQRSTCPGTTARR